MKVTAQGPGELFRAVLPSLPEHEIALRLAFRTERQQVLQGENPPECVGVVHEAALLQLMKAGSQGWSTPNS